MPLARKQGDHLDYIVCDHLGTPRELFSEDGQCIWAAEYTVWGTLRRLWQADNDNDPSRVGLQGYDLDGKPVYTTRVNPNSAWETPPTGGSAQAAPMIDGAARHHIDGNAALKAADNPDPHFCPIRFQGQWEDQETGLCYNRMSARGQPPIWLHGRNALDALTGNRQEAMGAHCVQRDLPRFSYLNSK